MLFSTRLRALLLAAAFLLPATRLRAQAPPAWTGAIELSPTGDNATASGQRVATGPGGALYNAALAARRHGQHQTFCAPLRAWR